MMFAERNTGIAKKVMTDGHVVEKFFTVQGGTRESARLLWAALEGYTLHVRLQHAGCAARILRHAKVFTDGTGRGFSFQMKHEGESVASVINRRAGLSLQTVKEIAWALFRAVDAIHRLGIAHCDLTPANVIVSFDESGRLLLRLVDFDSAFSTCTGPLAIARNERGGIATIDWTDGFAAPHVQWLLLQKEAMLGSWDYLTEELEFWRMADLFGMLRIVELLLVAAVDQPPPPPPQSPEYCRMLPSDWLHSLGTAPTELVVCLENWDACIMRKLRVFMSMTYKSSCDDRSDVESPRCPPEPATY